MEAPTLWTCLFLEFPWRSLQFQLSLRLFGFPGWVTRRLNFGISCLFWTCLEPKSNSAHFSISSFLVANQLLFLWIWCYLLQFLKYFEFFVTSSTARRWLQIKFLNYFFVNGIEVNLVNLINCDASLEGWWILNQLL